MRSAGDMTSVRVRHEDLERLFAAVLAAKGMRAEDAATVAEVLAWANLRGTDGHGAVRLASYLEFIDRGELDPKALPTIRPLGPTAFVLEAARAAGPVAMMTAARRAVEIARQYGVAIALVRETTHTGAVGRYPQWIAAQGGAGIMMNGGPPFMAYHGTRTARLGTNPIAIAVPGADGTALALDLATSVVSNGRLRQAAAAGETIPDGWALDPDGRVTRDAAQAAVILPLGGAKGSGLSFMFECLTGILAAAPVLTAFANPVLPKRHMQNALLIVLDVATFRPLDQYRADVGELVALLRNEPRQEGVAEILMPGERGARIAAKRRRDGIPLPAPLWKELCEIARTAGVSAPAVMGA
jgi:ureidoglycolate dehydrogenase (NAD+)